MAPNLWLCFYLTLSCHWSFVSWPFLTRFGENNKGPSIFPLIMDHTWSCSSSFLRPQCVRNRTGLSLSLPGRWRAPLSSLFTEPASGQRPACLFVPLAGGLSHCVPSLCFVFSPPTICHQQVFQKCNECQSLCGCEYVKR
jgi:hypothetical protein